jgi:hypothetical protein
MLPLGLLTKLMLYFISGHESFSYFFDRLTPGRCAQVIVNAYTTVSALSSTIFWQNDRVRISCGCPTYSLPDLASTEPTGSPAELILTQVKLYFFYDF